jgi:hypothetical protein
MLTTNQVVEVVKKYGPLVHLHPDEKYVMSSVEWFLERATLYHNGNKVNEVRGNQSLLPTGTQTDESYWLDIPSEARKGDMSTAVAYVHARASATAGMTDVQFWFFYPYNGPGTAKLFPIDKKVDLSPFGVHTGDWEHMVLTVDDKLVPHKMYLAQHSSGEWIALKPGDLTRRIELYASRNGHATYNTTGQNLTEEKKQKLLGQTVYDVGLRNDTDKGGPTLDCAARFQLLDGNEPHWLDFPGLWGPKVDYTKTVKEVLKDIPSPVDAPLKAILNALPDEVKGYQGPNGPKMKGTWSKA